jgi:hypothetical protein
MAKKLTDSEIQTWAAERNLFLNDKILRKDTAGDRETWVETYFNITYMHLAKEFPGDYKRLDGSPI